MRSSRQHACESGWHSICGNRVGEYDGNQRTLQFGAEMRHDRGARRRTIWAPFLFATLGRSGIRRTSTHHLPAKGDADTDTDTDGPLPHWSPMRSACRTRPVPAPFSLGGITRAFSLLSFSPSTYRGQHLRQRRTEAQHGAVSPPSTCSVRIGASSTAKDPRAALRTS